MLHLPSNKHPFKSIEIGSFKILVIRLIPVSDVILTRDTHEYSSNDYSYQLCCPLKED